MMGGVCAAGGVVDKERVVGRVLLELLHVLDGVVSHSGGEIPTGMPLEGVDGCRVAEQVGFPLAGVAADEAVEILEAHPDGPLIEWPGLARLVKGRIVVLAERSSRLT